MTVATTDKHEFTITLQGGGDTRSFAQRLDLLNITLANFILDCLNKLGSTNKLRTTGATVDRLAILYKSVDGKWLQLYDTDGLRTLLAKTDEGQELELKLEPSKLGRYSTWTNSEDALARFDIHVPLDDLAGFYPGKFDIPKKNSHLEHCIENVKEKIRGFRALLRDGASCREFITPVLLAAVLLVPSTRLDFEFRVVGDDNTGRVDYSVTKGTELICISEAKSTDMEEGTAMNLMQCQGALHLNKEKRKRDEFDYVYGVTTTGKTWRYIKLTSDNHVYRTQYEDFIPLNKYAIEDDTGLRAAIEKVIATITWMLEDRVKSDEPAVKRQRVNSVTKKDS